jgi:hypothetical protein
MISSVIPSILSAILRRRAPLSQPQARAVDIESICRKANRKIYFFIACGNKARLQMLAGCRIGCVERFSGSSTFAESDQRPGLTVLPLTPTYFTSCSAMHTHPRIAAGIVVHRR